MQEFAEFRSAVDAALAEFLDERETQLQRLSPKTLPLAEVMRPMLSGGKRLRPLFAAAGHQAAGGDPFAPEFIRAAAALELVQLSALVHDDLIDGSDTRRGLPAAHRAFEQRHPQPTSKSVAQSFGSGAAILLGDLALMWAGLLWHRSGLSESKLAAATTAFDEMLTEVTAGQYLDLWEQHAAEPQLADIWRVLELKTAKYTVERPLQIGALAENGSDELQMALTAYGRPLGIAFQLRDDLLGVYGDPSVTGKPAGDDIREGKQTALIALAREHGSSTDRMLLDESLGNPELDAVALESVRDCLERTGARSRVEALIDSQLELVAAAMNSELLAPAAPWLDGLAIAATRRSS